MQVIRGKSFQQCLCRLVRGIKIERSIPARNTFRGEKVVSEEQHSRWLEGCLATSRTQRGRSEKTDRSVRRGCISQQFSKMPDRAKHTSSERAFVVVVVVAKSEHAGGCDQSWSSRQNKSSAASLTANSFVAGQFMAESTGKLEAKKHRSTPKSSIIL